MDRKQRVARAESWHYEDLTDEPEPHQLPHQPRVLADVLDQRSGRLEGTNLHELLDGHSVHLLPNGRSVKWPQGPWEIGFPRMSTDRWMGLGELAAGVPDGASVAPGGFMLGRAPMALVRELARQGRRRLHVVSLPNPLPAEVLVAAGAVSRLDFAFGALTLGGRARPLPCLRRAIEENRIDWREHDGYRLVQRLRAAGMGVPFLPVPDADRSISPQWSR